MRLGRLFIRVGWSMWTDDGIHLIRGWRYPALLVRLDGERLVMGHGAVLGVWCWQLWLQVEDR